MIEPWPPGPRRPVLGGDEVHLWLANSADGLALACQALSVDELSRAARFRRAEDRARWMGARAVLRDVLVRYGAVAARESFVHGAHGKPAAADPAAPRFNLSHAGQAVLVAVGWTEVGVDIEAPRAADPLSLARHGLGEAVAVELAELEPQARTGEFLKRWTKHEALVKCAGTGLPGAAPGGLTVRGLVLDAPYAGAVAAFGRWALRAWTWTNESVGDEVPLARKREPLAVEVQGDLGSVRSGRRRSGS